MTPKEQRDAFILEVAKGRAASEALVVAGYDPKSASARMAMMHLQSDEGQDELARKRMQLSLTRAEANGRTSEDIIKDLREVYSLAIGTGELGHALKALEMEGKHRGTFADKIEISGKVDIVSTIIAARKRVSLANRDVEDAQVVSGKPILIEDFG